MVGNARPRRMRWGVGVPLLLGLILIVGCKPASKGFVSGRIVDESGSPVKGAKVVVRDLSATAT